MKMLYGVDMVKDMYETTIQFDDTPYKFQCQAHFTGTQYSVSFILKEIFRIFLSFGVHRKIL
jgi:hypothetical protein